MRQNVIIFDLDGTLALIEHRRHYVDCPRDQQNWDAFYDACEKDEPNNAIIKLNLRLATPNNVIYILSGRSDKVKEKTLMWLENQNIQFDHLIMRPDGCFTPDDELKKNWATQIGLGRILMVFDDRDKVVKMWRSLGITCLQVAEGNF